MRRILLFAGFLVLLRFLWVPEWQAALWPQPDSVDAPGGSQPATTSHPVADPVPQPAKPDNAKEDDKGAKNEAKVDSKVGAKVDVIADDDSAASNKQASVNTGGDKGGKKTFSREDDLATAKRIREFNARLQKEYPA